MERDEQRRADDLDRYWDAILRGEIPANSSSVGNEAAAVIAHLGEPSISEPHHGVQERVRARISRQARDLEDAMQTLSLPPPQVTANLHTAPVGPGSGHLHGQPQHTRSGRPSSPQRSSCS